MPTRPCSCALLHTAVALALLLAGTAAQAPPVPACVISIAGGGAGGTTAGFTDGSGTNALFSNPVGIVVRSNGDVVVADDANHKLRIITPAGLVFSFVGGGVTGSQSGAIDGVGTAALFSYPAGLAQNVSSNVLFVAEYGNHKVRVVSPTGVVTTLAGGGSTGTASGKVDGVGTAALFNNLNYVTASASLVFVSDLTNNKIRAITPAGVVTTLAGGGISGTTSGAVNGVGTAALISGAHGVAVDSSGNVFVTDSVNHKIRVITPAGVMSTFAGGGSSGTASGKVDGVGTAALFLYPDGAEVNASGHLFVTESGNHKLRVISPTGIVSTLAGGGATGSFGGFANGVGSSALFNAPYGITVDGASGTVYATDTAGNNIRKLVCLPTPSPSSSATPTPTRSTSTTVTSSPFAVFPPPPGYVAVVSTFAGATTLGSANGQGTAARFDSPWAVSIATDGSAFVADYNNNNVRAITPTGLVSTLASTFSGPSSIAMTPSGTLLIADFFSHSIRAVTPTGAVTTLAGSSTSGTANGLGSVARFNSPAGVAVSPDGSIYYVSEFGNHMVRTLTPGGLVGALAGSTAVGYVDGLGSAAAFNRPRHLTVASVGGAVFLADQSNNCIRRITPAGLVTTHAGNGAPGAANGQGTTAQFSQPGGISALSDGTLFIGDQQNELVRVISPTGLVSTLAGLATGYADGYGIAASFNSPHGIAVNSAGNLLLVVDYFNHMIRRITFAPCPAGRFCPGFSQALPCPMGSFCSAGAVAATPCSAMTYNAFSQQTSAASCLACPPNTGSGIGASVCTALTPTSLRSRSATVSTLPSHSPFFSLTSTNSRTPSTTPSPSPTPSPSLSPSPSASPPPTPSPTTSPTATASRSPAPFSCSSSLGGCVFASISLPHLSTRLVLSAAGTAAMDFASPPSPPYSSASISLLLPSPPSPNELLSIACGTDNSTLVFVTLAPLTSSPYAFVHTPPAALSFTGAVTGGGDTAASIALPLSISPLLTRVTAATPATAITLTCTLTSSLTSPGAGGVARVYPRYSPSSAVTLPITYFPPALPLAYDVLVELKPGSFLSSWSSSVNILPPSVLLMNTTSGGATGSNLSSATTVPSWQNATAVLASPAALSALMAVARTPPPPPSVWSLTLSGATHLVLIARPSSFSAGSPFSNATTVYIGGVSVTPNWVSPDGLLLSFTTPSYAALCGTSTTCGTRVLVVGDPLNAAAAMTLAASTDAATLTTIASSLTPIRSPLACPPACPGDVDALLTAAGGGALLAAAALAATPTPPPDTGGGGLFLVSACIGYTDPATGMCGNASSPLAAQCAWGAGDNCQPCPSGAVCPGGVRLWPRPGWWAASQDATPTDLLQCAPPATTRCPGAVSAGATAGAFSCGPGYLTGSVGCAGCAPSFFPSEGFCAPCPRSSIFLGIVVPALSVLAGALGICAFFTALSICLMRKRNAAFWPALQRTIQLVVWLWTALQALVQTARSAQAGAPPALLALFRGLTALQFEGVAVDSTCLSISPFATAWAQFGFVGLAALIIGAYTVAASSFCSVRRCMRNHEVATAALTPQHSRTALISIAALATLTVRTLVIFYAMLTNTALSMITCTASPLTVRGYLALASGDGSTLLDAATEGTLPAAASDALLAPGAIAALRAYSNGALPFVSLPPALAAVASPLLSSPLSVSVLARNPFQVCKEGEHAIISPVAWAVFALLSLTFPLACAFGVSAAIDARMRDASVVGEERARQWAEVRELGGWAWCAPLKGLLLSTPTPFTAKNPQYSSTTGGGEVIAQVNPLRAEVNNITASDSSSANHNLATSFSPSIAAHALVDATPIATAAPLLTALTTGSTRSSHGLFVQLDAAVLLILAVPVAYNTQAVGLGGRALSTLLLTQAGALSATLVATCAASVAVLRVRPFPSEFSWKGPAKAWIYALAGGSSVINFLQWWAGVVSSGAAASFSSLPSLVQGFSLLLLAFSALLLLYLCLAFVRSLLEEGEEEEEEEGRDVITRSEAGHASVVVRHEDDVAPSVGGSNGVLAPSAGQALEEEATLSPLSTPHHRWRRIEDEDGDVWWACDATGESAWDLPAGSLSDDGWVRHERGIEVEWTHDSDPARARIPPWIMGTVSVDARNAAAEGARSGVMTALPRAAHTRLPLSPPQVGVSEHVASTVARMQREEERNAARMKRRGRPARTR